MVQYQVYFASGRTPRIIIVENDYVFSPEKIENAHCLQLSCERNDGHWSTTFERHPLERVDFSPLHCFVKSSIYGSLGVFSHKSGTFASSMSLKTTEYYMCIIEKASRLGEVAGNAIFRIEEVCLVNLVTGQPIQCHSKIVDSSDDLYCLCELVQLLSSGIFYFDSNCNLSRRFQDTAGIRHYKDPFHIQSAFNWNRNMLKPVHDGFCEIAGGYEGISEFNFFKPCISGFIEFAYFKSSVLNVMTVIISRISSVKFGLGYRSRGLNDDGFVTNFVETETMAICQGYTFSYTILRGTVPVFWDQQGIQLGFPKIRITRTPAATQPAFDKHMNYLIENYGLVHLIDLLSQKEGRAENILSNAYKYHYDNYSNLGSINHTSFDVFSNQKEKLDSLLTFVGRDIHTFGYTLIDASQALIKQQTGLFRVNCLDCMDRTNEIQSFLSFKTIDIFLRSFVTEYSSVSMLFKEFFNKVWSKNGDQLSGIYLSSATLKSNFGRLGKFTIKSFVEDLKSITKRVYYNSREISTHFNPLVVSILTGDFGPNSLPREPSIGALNNQQISSVQQRLTDDNSILVRLVTWNTNATFPEIEYDYSPLFASEGGKS